MKQVTALVALFLVLLISGDLHAQRSSRGIVPFNGGSLNVRRKFADKQFAHPKTVIFLHAGFQDLSMWDKQPVPTDYNALYIDLPGHGQTIDGPRRANADSILLAVMDHYGIQRAALVSLSFGSAVALEFAGRHPERVSRLLMASPGVEGWDELGPVLPSTMEAFTGMMKSLEAKDTAAAARGFVQNWYLGPERKQSDIPPSLYNYGYATTLRNMREHHASGWPEFTPPTTVHRVRQVTAPVLLLVGGRDMPEVARVAAWLRKELPKARLVRFPNAAHMLNLEEPERFNRLLAAFLKEK